MKNREKWETRSLTANNIFQCHVRICFVTDSTWKRDLRGTSCMPWTGWAQASTDWVPIFLQLLCSGIKPSIPSAQQAQILGSGLCAPACPGAHEGNTPLQWLSLGTQKAGGRWFCEGGPHPWSAAHQHWVKGSSGAKIPGQCTPAELPREMGPASQTPKFGTWLWVLCPWQGLHRVCPGGCSLLGASSWAPEGTQTPSGAAQLSPRSCSNAGVTMGLCSFPSGPAQETAPVLNPSSLPFASSTQEL